MARDAKWPARFVGHDYRQAIPEPDDIQPGEPAPWSLLPLSAKCGLGLELVEARLHEGGRHLATSPTPGASGEIDGVADADAARQPITNQSAVLVALFEEEGETHLVLTRRSQHLRHHRGEIALPGGRSDENETPVTTALREAREEVGIDESSVTIVGWLSPIVTFASGSAIWPVVGLLDNRPDFVTDPSEVERAFTVSLADLLADDAFLEERWRRGEGRPGVDLEGYFPIQIFRVPGDLVWGATARVLTELLCVVTGVAWPELSRDWS